jgi:hypothetical protein
MDTLLPLSNTQTLWFEVGVLSVLFVLGHIYFGHFEERTPKWRKALKLFLFLALTVTLSATLGRAVAFGFLGLMLLGVVYIHAIWLPSKGINGWTGEPRDKYYALRGWKRDTPDKK